MAETPETKVKKKLKKFLDKAGIWHWSVSDRYKSGFPDIIACKEGRLICFEVKSDTGKMRKMQEYVGQQLVDAGAEYWVVRPDGEELEFISLQSHHDGVSKKHKEARNARANKNSDFKM